MKVLKFPVIVVTLFFIIGILLGEYIKFDIVSGCILCILAFAGFLISYRYSNKDFIQKPYFFITVSLLFLCLGSLVYSLHYHPNNSQHYSHFLKDDAEAVIKGIVSERIKPNAYQEKYYFQVTSINAQPVFGKILILVTKDSLTALYPGDEVIVSGNLKPINKALNPYQFDYAKYMEKQNVFHQVVLNNNFKIIGKVKSKDYYVENFRDRIMGSFDNHNLSPVVANVIKALLLGQRQDMDKEVNDNYTNAGVVHILAISGLHISILFYLLSMVLKPLDYLSHKTRLLKLIGIITFLWGFAILSGLSASVVRSVLMFSFVSVGLYFNRNANIYNSIAVSMLFLLAVQPNFLFDVGFQLSHIAVFAIVWTQPLYKHIRVSRYKIMNYFSETVFISLAAQIGVLPLSLYYFNQFPLLFLLANVVVIPVSNFILVIGIITIIFNFIYIKAGVVLGKMLSFSIDLMNGFIAWIASFESFVIKDIPFSFLLNITLYGILISLVLWFFNKSYYRTVTVLLCVLFFQSAYLGTLFSKNISEEFIVLHNRKNSIVALKNSNGITVYSNDSLALQNLSVRALKKANFSDTMHLEPMSNVFYFNGNKILVVDSIGVYNFNEKPDIILLVQSPQINLDRMLKDFRPKQIIADATNYKTYIQRWKATCEKEKILFHSTNEKGFYKIYNRIN